MSLSILAAAATLVAGLASRLAYRRANGRATARPQPVSESVTWFHRAYPLIQVLAMAPAVAALFLDDRFLLRTHAQTNLSVALGVAGMAASLLLFRRALRALAENYSPCYEQKAPRSLVTAGPYRFVRHPIYAANLALVASGWVAIGSAWILVALALLAAGYATSIPIEERVLEGLFQGYGTYRARTARIVPLLGRWGA